MFQGGLGMANIDARGLQCPQPVIMAKKALEEITSGEVLVIVDNTTAKENVSRLAANLNYQHKIEDKEGCYYIKISKSDAVDTKTENNDFVIVITSDKLGVGEDKLGQLLMKTYTYTLCETKPYPKAVIFINSGVKLVVENSEALENIQRLAESNIEIISCGTCLDYYNIKDKLRVGVVGNMYSIVEYMNNAAKVINIS
ncbi:MAG: SirA family protein [Clostridia bacterium]|jgi:selenium metabolism protein YedF|nr:SirA family protein [Clostridia bacterium]